MKFKDLKKENIAFLLIIWSIFLIWELQVNKWAETIDKPIMRVDLVVILPALIIVSYYLFKTIKNN